MRRPAHRNDRNGGVRIVCVDAVAHEGALPLWGVMVKACKHQSWLIFFGMAAGLAAAAPAVAAAHAVVRGAACRIDHGALVASAAFGAIAGDFLVDLSAPVSLLHDTRAGLEGIVTPSAVGVLTVAGRDIPATTLTVADLDARTGGFDTVINGVIGVDVLSRYVVEIDPAPCRIRLIGRSRGARPRPSRLAVEMTAGRPLVAARITDGVRVRSGLFALDTAAWPTTLYGDRLSREPPEAGAGRGAGAAAAASPAVRDRKSVV